MPGKVAWPDAVVRLRAEELLERCDAHGRLPATLSDAPTQLVLGLEGALA